jgi:thiol-disulfide isomerase/thioredoxin
VIKKILLVVIALTAALGAVAGALYVQNQTPMPPAISSAEASDASRPFVVKLHAQWCPVCMMTKNVWSEIQRAYSGCVNLVVFDFTTDATTDASRVEAKRLGLETVFDETAGSTGTILIIDGRTRQIATSIHGSRDFAEYRSAIDASLASGRSVGTHRPSRLAVSALGR